MNDKEMLELMTTCYERDTKLFKAKIAELEAELEAEKVWQLPENVRSYQADAIREMNTHFNNVITTTGCVGDYKGKPYQTYWAEGEILDYANNLEGKSDESVTR